MVKYRKNKKGKIGSYNIKKLSPFRFLTINSFDALKPGHNMMALLDFDVTEIREKLRLQKKNGKKVSLFSFIIKSIVDVINENKEFNSILVKRRIIEFEDIDVNIPIELNNSGEKFPHQFVIRKANEKSIEDIYEEINTAKKRHKTVGNTGTEDKWVISIMKKIYLLPKFIINIILKRFINNPLLIKKNCFSKNIPDKFILPY